ncbi:MAG: LCP family protein [Oscillospiraceae bacterium]|jgi:LCP family protein required for cell wall assembly|nr:LCP family protein [Oscillospiraceae bacterium]
MSEQDDDLLRMIQKWTEEMALEDQAPPSAQNDTPQQALRELEDLAKAPPAPIAKAWRELEALAPPQNSWTPPAGISAADAAAQRFWRVEEEQSRASAGLPELILPKQPPKKAAEGKKRMKKKHPAKRFFAWLLVLAIIFVCGSYALVYHEAKKVSYVDAPRTTDTAGFRKSALVTNILLIGVDRQGEESNGRSDTMLLLSIDRIHHKLKLTSFLRDSWVTLPDGSHAKLNAASSKGGAALAAQTVEQNFRVRIDHYAMVDFSSFEYVIDALGGIAVPVTDKELDFLCKNTRLGKQIGKESMRVQMEREGAVRFTGEQALIYCRIRALDNDFERTKRQRKVMQEIISQIKQENPLRWLKLAEDVLPNIETDMAPFTMANLALLAPAYLGYETEQHRVPADGTWKDSRKSGASVLEMNLEENQTALEAFIYE